MAFKDAFLKHLDESPLPDLGSIEQTYQLVGDDVRLTMSEQEINAICFAVSFAQHALASARMKRFLSHYGPHLETVKEKLASTDETPSN